MNLGQTDFGILRHRRHANATATFDGWFPVRGHADEVYADAVLDHPDSVVHLVTRLRSEWRDGSV